MPLPVAGNRQRVFYVAGEACPAASGDANGRMFTVFKKFQKVFVKQLDLAGNLL